MKNFFLFSPATKKALSCIPMIMVFSFFTASAQTVVTVPANAGGYGPVPFDLIDANYTGVGIIYLSTEIGTSGLITRLCRKLGQLRLLPPDTNLTWPVNIYMKLVPTRFTTAWPTEIHIIQPPLPVQLLVYSWEML